ncbi:BTB/POZ domain-containing protein [Ditylenchus destructor]|nr:BTB/POZ domain-containing protein [Ditylenchus destructor]
MVYTGLEYTPSSIDHIPKAVQKITSGIQSYGLGGKRPSGETSVSPQMRFKPDSFLARLVNGVFPSEKDESGAYLFDANPEHFRTIVHYLRKGSVKLGGSTMNLKGKMDLDLLRKADFLIVLPLIDKIRRAMRFSTSVVLNLRSLSNFYRQQNQNTNQQNGRNWY